MVHNTGIHMKLESSGNMISVSHSPLHPKVVVAYQFLLCVVLVMLPLLLFNPS